MRHSIFNTIPAIGRRSMATNMDFHRENLQLYFARIREELELQSRKLDDFRRNGAASFAAGEPLSTNQKLSEKERAIRDDQILDYFKDSNAFLKDYYCWAEQTIEHIIQEAVESPAAGKAPQ